MTAVDPELKGPLRKMPTMVMGPVSTRILRRISPLLLPKTPMEGLAVTDLPTPGASTSMIIVRRAESTSPAPVVLWIHGGGYIMGTNKAEHRWAAAFCERTDCAVVAAGYRLAPEHPFPAALDDLRAAAAWILDHGANHGLDPSRIVVAGESAGGGLAAALAQRLHDEAVPIKGQILVYPMLDDRTAARTDIGRKEHKIWTNGSNHYGWSSYLGALPGGESTPTYAVPARRADLRGLPPAWICVGDLDVFHDEDTEYARRLEEAGVRVTLEIAPGAPHGFLALAPKATITRRVIDSVLDFADRALTESQG